MSTPQSRSGPVHLVHLPPPWWCVPGERAPQSCPSRRGLVPGLDTDPDRQGAATVPTPSTLFWCPAPVHLSTRPPVSLPAGRATAFPPADGAALHWTTWPQPLFSSFAPQRTSQPNLSSTPFSALLQLPLPACRRYAAEPPALQFAPDLSLLLPLLRLFFLQTPSRRPSSPTLSA